MSGQICKTCKYKHNMCYCSPNSICFEYEEKVEHEHMEESMVRAANEASITQEHLFDIFAQYGLFGIYNLGMEHMYNYLKGEKNE